MSPAYSRLILILLAWAAAAAALAASGVLAHTAVAVVPAGVFLATALVLVAAARVPWLRRTLDALNLTTLLGIHVTRFVGATFLWEAAHGRLPQVFANRAGWGDIAAAAGALLFLLWPRARASTGLLLLWTVVGVVDLLVAVGTAGWLAVTGGPSMATMLQLPFALVPLFGVPVLLVAHAEIFRRIRQRHFTCQEPEATSVPDLKARSL